MGYKELTDPVDFRRRTSALLADEARHNLIRGVLGNLIHGRGPLTEAQMFVVTDGDETVAAALMTKPYNLILADAPAGTGLGELVAGLTSASVAVPGAIGNRPTVDRFVAVWVESTGEDAELEMEQGVFAIDAVNPGRDTDGQARAADIGDAELVFEWTNEFIDEALPNEPRDDEMLRRSIARRLTDRSPSGVWLWEVNGRPRSMTGHGSPTGSGIRIGGVYTPPSERGYGYASAVVAAQAAWLLGNGYNHCFLFTDLSNPTSNAIYERIGYRQVAEGASYRFSGTSRDT